MSSQERPQMGCTCGRKRASGVPLRQPGGGGDSGPTSPGGTGRYGPGDGDLDRRTFLGGIGAGMALVGLGAGTDTTPAGVAIPPDGVLAGRVQPQVGAGGADGDVPEGAPDVRSSVATLVEGIVADTFNTGLAYVGLGVSARCPHDDERAIETEVAERYGYPDGPDDTDLVVGTTVSVPPGSMTFESRSGLSDFSHAVAGGGIAYEFDVAPFGFVENPDVFVIPVGAKANETVSGTATAAAVAVYGEAGEITRRYEKVDEDTVEGTPAPGTEGERDADPVQYAVGSVELAALEGRFLPLPDDIAVPAAGEGTVQPVDPVAIDSTLDGLESWLDGRSSADAPTDDGTVTIHIDLTEFGPTTGSPSEFTFTADGDEYVLTIDVPDTAFHLDIALPGEAVTDPPDGLPVPLEEHLRRHAEAADESSLTIQWAVERPFDDLVEEYLGTPGTRDHDRFRSLAPGESMSLETPVQVGSRVDRAVASDDAALSWTDIEAGTSLVNDNVGSLPLGSFALGGKTIEFTPLPVGEADNPIVVQTGGDGRIQPSRTLRGEPSTRRPDYEVSMARADVHAILGAPARDRAAVAADVWDGGGVAVRPRGLFNRLNYGLATRALAVARLLGA